MVKFFLVHDNNRAVVDAIICLRQVGWISIRETDRGRGNYGSYVQPASDLADEMQPLP